MLKRVLFSVIVLQQWLFLGANADECSSDARCVRFRDCPNYLNTIGVIPVAPYCNLNERATYICCPESNFQKDENKRSVRAIPDCKSYQSVRSKCETHSVVGRDKAHPKEYPFTALIFQKHENNPKWLCVGTLISSRFVLTVAHCFYGNEIPNGVRLGELDFNSTDDDASPIDFGIKNYTVHPNFDYFTILNDIALVELDAEVQFNDYIMPACLPLAADERRFNKFTAAGWNLRFTRGNSKHLLVAEIDQFDKASCLAESGVENNFNDTLQICAGSHSNRSVGCQIMSGSPIFVDHPDYKCMALVMGITSYGISDCSNSGIPDIYTRVPAFIDWIKSII